MSYFITLLFDVLKISLTKLIIKEVSEIIGLLFPLLLKILKRQSQFPPVLKR